MQPIRHHGGSASKKVHPIFFETKVACSLLEPSQSVEFPPHFSMVQWSSGCL